MSTRNLVYKLDPGTETLNKLTNVNPIKEGQQTDITWLYAPYGTNVAKVKYFPNKFFGLTGVNPIPALKMFPETDEEVIASIIPEGEVETGWSLFYYPIGRGISGILKSNRASQYEVSFEELEVDNTDQDYIGEYATASTVDATVNAELKVQFPSAVTGNYVNVYQTALTEDSYNSWLFDGVDWSNQDELFNAQLGAPTQPFTETFKATSLANEDFSLGDDASESALVLNQIYSELAELNALVSAITGGQVDFMEIADYDTDGTATQSVKYARNIGIDGNSVNYITVLQKLGWIDQDVKTTASPEFANATLSGNQIETQNNKGVANGYVPLDGSVKIERQYLPEGIKVFKGTFGSAGSTTGGDLPTVGVVIGDTYRCDTDDYNSAVAGIVFDTNDTATWTGTAWIKNSSGEVDTVNGIAPDANGDVELKANNINREDDSETIEASLDDIEERRDYVQGTQVGPLFSINALDTTLYKGRAVKVCFDSLVAGTGDVQFSIDNGVTYKYVVNDDDDRIDLSLVVFRGDHLLGFYDPTFDSGNGGWQIVNTEADFRLITGSGWDGTPLVSVKSENDQQNVRLDALEQAVATPGENILQITNMTIPFTAGAGLTKLVLDTNSEPSNDTNFLNVDGNLDQIVVDSQSPGYNFTGNFSITKQSGTFSTFQVTFYLFNDADPKIIANALDSVTVTVPSLVGNGTSADRSKSITVTNTDLQAIGLPITFVIYYNVDSGGGTIDSGVFETLSLFSSSGIPTPTNSGSVSLVNASVESLSGLPSTQQENNIEFVDKFNEIGKVQQLLEVASGQFKIDSASPLLTNNKYMFKFPIATADSDLDVEISVDNGLNYYDVEFRDTSFDLKVGDVSNNVFDLYFNGTVFVASFADTPLENVNLPYGGNVGQFTIPFDEVPATIAEDTLTPITQYKGSDVLAQLVLNGDFADGTTNWSVLGSTNAINSDGNLENTADGTSVNPSAFTGALVSGQNTYLQARLRVTNSDSTALVLRSGDGVVTVSEVSPNQNEWYTLSVLGVIGSNENLVVRHTYVDTATANGKVLEVDYAIAIPVPDGITTVAEMEKYLDGTYWEGLNYAGKPFEIDQLLDNRNEFGAWTLESPNVTVDLEEEQQNVPYIKFEGDGVTFWDAEVPTNLQDNTTYTIFAHFIKNTNDNTFNLVEDANYDSGGDINIPAYTTGIVKEKFTTGTIVSNVLKQFARPGDGDVIIRNAILEGDWTNYPFTDEDILNIIKYNEFGTQEFKGIRISTVGNNKLDKYDYEQGSINTSGVESDSDTRIRIKANVLGSTEYTLSCVDNRIRIINEHDINGNFISNLANVGAFNSTEETFTTSSNAHFIQASFNKPTDTDDITPIDGYEDEVMLNIGAVADEYEEYKEEIAHIDGELLSSRDNLDYQTDARDFNKVVQNATSWSRVGPLTNSVIFAKDLTSELGYKVTATSADIANASLRIGDTTYSYVPQNTAFALDQVGIFYIATSNVLAIKVDVSLANSTQFEAFLQANDVEFIYELAEAKPRTEEKNNVIPVNGLLQVGEKATFTHYSNGVIGKFYATSSVNTKSQGQATINALRKTNKEVQELNVVVDRNEQSIKDIKEDIGFTDDLTTTSKELVGAINENKTALDSKITITELLSTKVDVSSATTKPSSNISLTFPVTSYDALRLILSDGTTGETNHVDVYLDSNGDDVVIQFPAILGTAALIQRFFRLERDGAVSLTAYHGSTITTTFGSPANITYSATSAIDIEKIYGLIY